MGENNTERYIVAFEIGSSKIRGAIEQLTTQELWM